jgi:hypothetical protein
MKTFSALALVTVLASAFAEEALPHDASHHEQQCADGIQLDCVVSSDVRAHAFRCITSNLIRQYG